MIMMIPIMLFGFKDLKKWVCSRIWRFQQNTHKDFFFSHITKYLCDYFGRESVKVFEPQIGRI
jgi:hypothetical protein